MIDKLHELYCACFPEHEVMRNVFIEQLQPESAHTFAEYADGRLAGFAMAHSGSIPVLCVAREYRRQGIGSRLLESAEGYLRGCGAGKITLGAGPHYLLQGVPATEENLRFFEKRGYSAGWTSINMELSLRDFSREKLNIHPAPADVNFRFAGEADRPSLLAAVEAAEPGWVDIFEDCTDPVLVAEAGGEIIGFEILSPEGGYFLRLGEKVGSVGCVGVVPDQREHGVGLQMVAHGLEWLQSKYATLVELRYTWLEDWYGKLGFATVSRQWMGEKEL